METSVGPFFRMEALLWSSVDGNEWEAIGEDLNSLWSGAISWSCWLADVSLSFHNITGLAPVSTIFRLSARDGTWLRGCVLVVVRHCHLLGDCVHDFSDGSHDSGCSKRPSLVDW